MGDVAAFDAKKDFPTLLERVEKGETITITRGGVPVARLVPIDPTGRLDRAEVIRQLKEFGKGRRLNGVTVQELIDEGRRF